MDSYEGFADRYDRLMEWGQRQQREEPFFRDILPKDALTVLDCHCGTGFHCAMLARMGYYVEGVDISPRMLAAARRNLESRDLHVRLHLCDVKAMQPGRAFDCVLSMGNSLPHEFGDANLLQTLRRMYGALRPGGLCIVHTENFDRLYRDHDRFIPTRFSRDEDGGEAFIVAVDYGEGRVVFNILSIIEEDGVPRFNVDAVEYNPVPVAKICDLMGRAGFREIKIYGDFRRTPIAESESYDAIFVARKPALRAPRGARRPRRP